jgi:enamine deaminase RidA (YjgF/YER057c/UK114 family)
VHAAGGKVTDIATMTVYVTDVVAYRTSMRALGPIWKERMGQHYPAMALVAVSALVEPEAVVEIQVVAYLEHLE